MAIIELIGLGERCDFSVSGTQVTVGDLVIDCSDYQDDSEVCVDICHDGNAFVLGCVEGGAYVMSIIIPPKCYVDVMDEEDDGAPIYKRVAAPMDARQLRLRLWPYYRLDKHE